MVPNTQHKSNIRQQAPQSPSGPVLDFVSSLGMGRLWHLPVCYKVSPSIKVELICQLPSPFLSTPLKNMDIAALYFQDVLYTLDQFPT